MCPPAPDAREVVAAIATAIKPWEAQLESVMLHGSVVRGDFWPGQSDIDVMVIGRAEDAPVGVEAPLKALAHAFPDVYEVEVHRCSLGIVTIEKGRPFAHRWIQFGLHGFDLKQNHRVCTGSDQFADVTVPGTDQLCGLAVTRVTTLHECVTRREAGRYENEMYKWACEVIKATQLYFAVRAGRDPTRDKRVVYENFTSLVPGFAEKADAEVIWEHYRQGARRTDAEYLEVCDRFVRGAWGALYKAVVSS